MRAIYTKTYQSQIRRIEHQISIWKGLRAEDIREGLRDIPNDVRITDIWEDDDVTTLVFLEERAVTETGTAVKIDSAVE